MVQSRGDGREGLGYRMGKMDPGVPWSRAGAGCAYEHSPPEGGAAVGLHVRKPSMGGSLEGTRGGPGEGGQSLGPGRASDISQTGEPRGDGGNKYGK